MTSPIFLDNHSTTPVDPRVADIVLATMLNDYGNASSADHVFGRNADTLCNTARRRVIELLDARNAKVVFTSGATEAINLVISDVVLRNKDKKPARIALPPTEHAAVVETCNRLAKMSDIELVHLQVDSYGRLDLEHLNLILNQGIDLVCVMAANNEIGNIYPVPEIANLCSNATTPFLCDASQAAGKVNIHFDNWKITYLVFSGHKMYGPKGIGALVCDRSRLPNPLFAGGNQEFGVRPGTLNVPGIVGLGEACRLRQLEMNKDEKTIASKRDRLQQLLTASIEGLSVNGDQQNRLAGNLHISIPGALNDAVIARLFNSLAISRGASCSSGIEKPSHVLQALGLGDTKIESAFRIGIGKFTTNSEIETAAELFIKAVNAVRSRNAIDDYQRV